MRSEWFGNPFRLATKVTTDATQGWGGVKTRVLFALLWACTFVVGGCSEAREARAVLSGLEEVQRQVAAAIGHERLDVNLTNGRFLTVGIVNSPFGELPEAQKQAKAREIAVLAYEAFPSRTALDRVAVVFVVNRNYLLVFNVTDATDYHGFAASEFGGSRDSNP